MYGDMISTYSKAICTVNPIVDRVNYVIHIVAGWTRVKPLETEIYNNPLISVIYRVDQSC